jgi:hypothetical protein
MHHHAQLRVLTFDGRRKGALTSFSDEPLGLSSSLWIASLFLAYFESGGQGLFRLRERKQ